jgi:putative Mn2+ efflux pump MntP
MITISPEIRKLSSLALVIGGLGGICKIFLPVIFPNTAQILEAISIEQLIGIGFIFGLGIQKYTESFRKKSKNLEIYSEKQRQIDIAFRKGLLDEKDYKYLSKQELGKYLESNDNAPSDEI